MHLPPNVPPPQFAERLLPHAGHLQMRSTNKTQAAIPSVVATIPADKKAAGPAT